MEVYRFLVEWFCKKTLLSCEDIESNSAVNYFELRWINSFETLSLVADIEEHFNVFFENEDFQNSEFATVVGLCRIIEGKINA